MMWNYILFLKFLLFKEFLNIHTIISNCFTQAFCFFYQLKFVGLYWQWLYLTSSIGHWMIQNLKFNFLCLLTATLPIYVFEDLFKQQIFCKESWIHKVSISEKGIIPKLQSQIFSCLYFCDGGRFESRGMPIGNSTETHL